MAGGGDLGRSEAPVTPPLVLASTSPQRRAILAQLRVPFTAEAPAYEEHDPPDADPVTLVRGHAVGKARSVHRPGQVTLGVDTTVHLDGIVYAKPRDAQHARLVLRELSGRTHVVLSGVCLLSDGGEDLEHAETRVRFRPLGERELERYIVSGEWEGRAGGYAIQGLGGRLVEWVEGDYLNVVGLPGALLVDLLERRAPGLLS
jgi:septum formation protein